MSIIGKKVTYEYPVSNDKKEQGSGVVVDKFVNSFMNEQGQVMTYDNYMLRKEGGDAVTIHPTLIIKIEDVE